MAARTQQLLLDGSFKYSPMHGGEHAYKRKRTAQKVSYVGKATSVVAAKR